MSDSPVVYDLAFFQAHGKSGGLARKAKLTPKQRKRAAKKAAKARWNASKTVV